MSNYNLDSVSRRQAARMLLGTAGACALAAPTPPRPNIVFILVHDLRWNALGCTGHPFSQTPNIDRIAKEGATFTNAFVTTSLCSPSRASFLTGRYVHAHGVLGNGDSNALSHRLITWPRLLHDSGYETAYVGKFHMGNDDTPRPGFDRWVSFKGQGRYDSPDLNIDGQQVKSEGYVTDILSGHAVDFLKKRHSKPFVLYLGHKAVHGPFTPAERHKDLYSDQKIEHRPNVYDDLEGKPVLQRTLKAGAKAGKKAGPVVHDQVMLNQLRCLRAIDESTGQILQTLKDTGHLDNTLIMFTSDNGYLWGEHGLGDKRACYEESMRIPLLARYPKMIQPGQTIQQMIINVDCLSHHAPTGGRQDPGGGARRIHGAALPGQQVRMEKILFHGVLPGSQFCENSNLAGHSHRALEIRPLSRVSGRR